MADEFDKTEKSEKPPRKTAAERKAERSARRQEVKDIREKRKEMKKEKIRAERRRTLEELFPKSIICDYDRYARDIYMMWRIRRHGWAFKVVNLIERVLFKMEKRQSKRKQEQVWN